MLLMYTHCKCCVVQALRFVDEIIPTCRCCPTFVTFCCHPAESFFFVLFFLSCTLSPIFEIFLLRFILLCVSSGCTRVVKLLFPLSVLSLCFLLTLADSRQSLRDINRPQARLDSCWEVSAPHRVRRRAMTRC